MIKKIIFLGFMGCCVIKTFGQITDEKNKDSDILYISEEETNTSKPDSLIIINNTTENGNPQKLSTKDDFFTKDSVVKTKILTQSDYKIISIERDTTFIDTSLTIHKYYKFNPLRTDMFNHLPFSNDGHVATTLVYDFSKPTLFPKIGLSAKHIAFKNAEDIVFYKVGTPATELFYKNGIDKGQFFDGFISVNTSRQLNLTIGYTAHTSRGEYKNMLSQSDRFLFSSNYQTKNNRYNIRFHFQAQFIEHNENGGLLDPEVEFEAGDSDFDVKNRINVQFEDANSELVGRRYYFDHQFNIIQSDSTQKFKLSINHAFKHEIKYYNFDQNEANPYIGNSFLDENIHDHLFYNTLQNNIDLNLSSSTLGTLKLGFSQYYFAYFFNRIIYNSNSIVPNRLSNDEYAYSINWEKHIGKKLYLKFVGAATNPSTYGGYFGSLNIQYPLSPNFLIALNILSNSSSPNLNTLLYQSDYQSLNWHNTFKEQYHNHIEISLKHKPFGTLGIKINNLNNYVYFYSDNTENVLTSLPKQYDKPINYTLFYYKSTLTFWKFSIDNHLVYQHVIQDDPILNVPTLYTRNTLFLNTSLFNNAMPTKFGVSFRYFTSYYARNYNPIIGEFFVRNDKQIGDYPIIDFFISGKIRQARLFFNFEHFNQLFITKNNYYSAPDYPYRDFIFRFGIVWNLYI